MNTIMEASDLSFNSCLKTKWSQFIFSVKV